jgi:hypothetical protein
VPRGARCDLNFAEQNSKAGVKERTQAMSTHMSKSKIPHTVTFTCCDKNFQQAEIKSHLKEAHNLTELKGSKKMVLALDGDEYCNIYEYTISGVTFTKTCKGPKGRQSYDE